MLDFSIIIELGAHWKWLVISLCIVTSLAFLIQRRYRTGIRDVPGPFLASIFPFDRISSALSGKQYLTHIKYHERYGQRVRVGPNHVSFSDPNVIAQLYGITTKFYKVGSAYST